MCDLTLENATKENLLKNNNMREHESVKTTGLLDCHGLKV
jgi:hypothetical protein